jgi:hypothetical protein
MTSLKADARRAGALYFVFLIVGLVDMLGFTGFMVPGDATATARNIVASEGTFRIGILTDLVTLLLFLFLVISLYHLLRSVDRWHATLMVLFVSVGVTIGCVNLLSKIGSLIVLHGPAYSSVLSQPQLDALVLGCLSLNSSGNDVASVFWGLWLFPFGILVVRSTFLPRILGFLLLVAGLGYLTTGVTSIVLPAYSRVVSQATMPLLLGEFPIIFWLLIKGATVPAGSAQTSVASELSAPAHDA